MFDQDATLRQVLDAVILKWGTTAVLQNVSAVVGWNAMWHATPEAAKATQAAHMIAEAAEIVRQIEETEHGEAEGQAGNK
jgi:hypothetical protein